MYYTYILIQCPPRTQCNQTLCQNSLKSYINIESGLPYKHSTRGPPEASNPMEASHHPPLGGTEVGCKMGLRMATLVSSVPTPTSGRPHTAKKYF